ncbi:MAG TPA: hypothetical protein VEA37_09490 [Flavobacterium sp.]|nr:hypothetical protein [Flavobacterium sp.]
MDIKISNILKVVDVHRDQLYQEVLLWLAANVEPTYKDQVLKEHIYGSEILEELEQGAIVPPMVKDTLESISQLCRDNEAGYFRIIHS